MNETHMVQRESLEARGRLQMLPLTSYLLPSPLWPRPPLTDGSSVVAALLPSNLLGGIFAHVS